MNLGGGGRDRKHSVPLGEAGRTSSCYSLQLQVNPQFSQKKKLNRPERLTSLPEDL